MPSLVFRPCSKTPVWAGQYAIYFFIQFLWSIKDAWHHLWPSRWTRVGAQSLQKNRPKNRFGVSESINMICNLYIIKYCFTTSQHDKMFAYFMWIRWDRLWAEKGGGLPVGLLNVIQQFTWITFRDDVFRLLRTEWADSLAVFSFSFCDP